MYKSKKIFRFSIFLLYFGLIVQCFAGVNQSENPFETIVHNEKLISVENVNKGKFDAKYVIMFDQLLEHSSPDVGHFEQRIVVCHRGFDLPTVFVTEGYDAAYALSDEYVEELSVLLNANVIVLEHRYFAESTPDLINWDHLTIDNSMHDLHSVRELLKDIYPEQWIATGISKGGSTTIMYCAYYPNDVDAWVPYVAPIARRRHDPRCERFMKLCETKEHRREVKDFQVEILKNRQQMMPLFREYCDKNGYKFRVPLEEVYDMSVLEFQFAYWQMEGGTEGCIPSFAENNIEYLFKYFVDIIEPSYFSIDSMPSFFVQAMKEFGYYGYRTRPFRKYLTIKSADDYMQRFFMPDNFFVEKFDNSVYKHVTKYLSENDPRMIFIYGELDPWTSAGVSDRLLVGKQNMKKYVQPKGTHRTRISTMPEDMQNSIISTLKTWLKLN